MIDKSFPRELRLLTPEHFKNVFADPVRSASPHITILAKNNSLGHPRLGLAVPKKAIKLAVGRNRVKRLIRESFRTRQHDFPNVDIVVIAKSGIANLENAEIDALLEKLWRKLCRRCNG
ncbi:MULTISPECIES: ribonuclease P protein component [Moritella]|uniref:ribonuclease P protein component n=1 Tax=Moritella sp. TaxID=78556 RepID=UPI000A01A381|nr:MULTISPECIES: ribonuclease P protein component [Moritella]MBL1416636.1 ribonuclease P protein component [Moritella sp.]MCJ8352038.1 ribonuclease P protein component [Moritella sp.]NQZ42155.1 ribonuclease P protein component [Moritella sp.]NQZ49026.1 ribonuclease P protein component [Moritella sp.]NQZ94576.1 ribonuclease P protein component [Moritella sp.]